MFAVGQIGENFHLLVLRRGVRGNLHETGSGGPRSGDLHQCGNVMKEWSDAFSRSFRLKHFASS